MPSPFPGMDPYIESPAHWGDFHGCLITAICESLNERLPPEYIAATDLYVWIHEPDARTRMRLGKPDVMVAGSDAERGRAAGSTKIVAPQQLILPAVAMEGSKYVKILDAEYHRIITVFELLSPKNKQTGPDRDGYLAKRNEYIGNRVNLVEIDLLRAGKRMPLTEPPPVSHYYIMVARGHERPRVDFWPLSIRDQLPDVPVPLEEDVPEISLPLKSCIDRVYEGGRYAKRFDYRHPPKPPLRKADAAWARELLKSRTLHK